MTNSLKFYFPIFCRVLLLLFFFVPVFISCFVLFCGFFLAVTGNWEALSYYVFQNPNNYFLYMFMTSLRREPVRRQQNCPIATIWCRIKCVLTKNSLFKQFFPSKQFWVYCKLISTHCQSWWKTECFGLIIMF